MPAFGTSSAQRLKGCHPNLQRLFNEVVKHVDCSILCGERDEAEQTELFRTGRSKVEFPHSKHNASPSMAVDAAPYPINWNDKDRFYYFAGVVKGIASQMGIEIRWGGDWDSDNIFNDQTFFDLPHFEIVEQG